MLNSKEETVLVQTLITHNIHLNEEIEDLEEKLEITKTRLKELYMENEKLKRRLNLVHRKTSPTPF